jgi:acyl-coenzyme A synthetase/AMP-(fatty) acid ligase
MHALLHTQHNQQHNQQQMIDQYDLSSLRVLGSVGEPINPEAWRWYYEYVGKQKCSIVDTWWQTETGGHLITPLPYTTHMKVSVLLHHASCIML